MTSKVAVDSPSVEEASSGGNIRGGVPLKKGPWTKEEDAVLIDYIRKHGEGNWSAVQKHSGLARCGKSCRLRWANHLRPDLKKGALTPEEVCRINELHAKMGNKWAQIAAKLPGHTDNEIKNYWSTRIKKQQGVGLQMYPPDICFQAFTENKHNKELRIFSPANSLPDFLPINGFEIPSVEFKKWEPSQQLYPRALVNIAASSFFDIPATSLLAQALSSSNTCSGLSTMHPSKHIRGSESWFFGITDDLFQACHQYQNDGSLFAQSLGFYSSYTHNLTSDHHPSFSAEIPGSHAPLNGNSSSSEPKWAKKLELPSLQIQMANWGSPSPLPSLESFDALIQYPPNEHADSSSLSPRNSGLLDAVLYESQTSKASKHNSHQETSCDVVDDSCPDLQETQWGTYSSQISPLGHSAASALSEYTPTEVHWMSPPVNSNGGW